MTAIDLRTEIVQLLRDESNTKVLEAIRTLLRRAEIDMEEEFTTEDMNVLNERRAEYKRGGLRTLSAEESVKELREAQARDEEV